MELIAQLQRSSSAMFVTLVVSDVVIVVTDVAAVDSVLEALVIVVV